jgi:electron transfer flavoprotein alpha subunit
MEKILVLVHTLSNGSLSRASLETLTWAKNVADFLSAELNAGVMGKEVQSATAAISEYGVSKIFTISDPLLESPRYATDAGAVTAFCQKAGATLILAADDSRFSRVLAGVSVRMKGRIDTHVTDIKIKNETLLIQRWFYRQRLQGTLTRSQRPWFLTLASGIVEQKKSGNKLIQIENIPLNFLEASIKTQFMGIQSPSTGEQTIRPDAKLLFVAGAGWCKVQKDGNAHVPEAEKIILGFLNKSQSSLGGSKSLVDQSGEGQAILTFMTHLNQVGQTGSTPRHPKGLATCCHGEEPHCVGWRFINERRAINLDENCGWAHGKADVLYVGDAFDIIPKVSALLE